MQSEKSSCRNHWDCQSAWKPIYGNKVHKGLTDKTTRFELRTSSWLISKNRWRYIRKRANVSTKNLAKTFAKFCKEKNLATRHVVPIVCRGPRRSTRAACTTSSSPSRPSPTGPAGAGTILPQGSRAVISFCDIWHKRPFFSINFSRFFGNFTVLRQSSGLIWNLPQFCAWDWSLSLLWERIA